MYVTKRKQPQYIKILIHIINKARKVVLVIAVHLLICGCDWSLRIIGMKLISYPDKLIYIANKDNSLELTGGEVQFILADKSIISIEPMTDEMQMDIIHEIDFSTPGVYIVRVYRHDSAYVEFPILVISEQQLVNLCENFQN